MPLLLPLLALAAVAGSHHPQETSSPHHQKLAGQARKKPTSSGGLRYMSLYGWETTLTVGMEGWVNLPLGPVYNRTANPQPTLPELLDLSIASHKQVGQHASGSVHSCCCTSARSSTLVLNWLDQATARCVLTTCEVLFFSRAAQRAVPLGAPSRCADTI